MEANFSGVVNEDAVVRAFEPSLGYEFGLDQDLNVVDRNLATTPADALRFGPADFDPGDVSVGVKLKTPLGNAKIGFSPSAYFDTMYGN